MIVDRNGNEIDAVQVPDGSRTFECFRVRVIREIMSEKGFVKKREVAGEEDFKEFPNEGQFIYCIAKHHGDFAVVEKVVAVEILPFA